MGGVALTVSLLNLLCLVLSDELNALDEEVFETKSFVLWPNGTVPFYINPDHFDNEQSMTILRALSLFAFVTCLKFAPVMVPPTEEHVLAFENPGGWQKCQLQRQGYSRAGPHIISLGYDCLESPMMERVIMRALGFPLEHNRASRDSHIDVQLENVEQTAIELFTKEYKLPAELRQLPYDINSVMHFGDREYSKNGHRTIIFKDRDAKQTRNGLSPTDIRKIEIVYGPECRRRDRQEKIDLCHTYPVRRKRDVGEVTKSLRVNPDITPPPEGTTVADSNENVSDIPVTLINLGISAEVRAVIHDVYKIIGKALQSAREKHCNDSEGLRVDTEAKVRPDILGITRAVAGYAQSIEDNAVANKSMFCETSSSVDKYQRFLNFKCIGYADVKGVCALFNGSTQSVREIDSTQHRPIIPQKGHIDGVSKSPKDDIQRRTSNDTEVSREKRDIKELDATKQATDAEATEKITILGTNKPHLNGNDDEDKGPSRRHDSISEENRMKAWGSSDSDDTESGVKSDEDRVTKKRPRLPKHGNRVKPRYLPTTVTLSKANEEFYSQRRWPRGVVPYMINKTGNFDIIDLRSRLDEVSRLLAEHTCARLREISPREADEHEAYLVLDRSPDYIPGRVGGKQVTGTQRWICTRQSGLMPRAAKFGK